MNEKQAEIASKILKDYKKDHFQKSCHVGDTFYVESQISTIKISSENDVKVKFDKGAFASHAAMQALNLQKEFGDVANVMVNSY